MMPENKLLRIGAYAGAILSVIGVFVLLQTTVKDIVKTSSETLSLEIKRSARDLADIHRTDLRVRIRVLNREIEELEQMSPLPQEKALHLQRLKSQRDDLHHQVDEVEEKWFEH